MAIIMTPPPVPPSGGPPDAPATLTVTYYQQLATHFSEIIDEIASIIPRDPEQARGAQFRRRLNVPLKFLGTAVASVAQVEQLQITGKLDVNRGRDTLQLLEAFRPIVDKAAAFREDLENLLDSRQSSLAGEGLEAYHVAQGLARDESNPTLTQWVANMKRDLGRRGPRKQKDPVPNPVPVPTTALVPKGRQG
jgi:hypothetical protein